MEIWKEVSRFIAKIRTVTLTGICFFIGLMCMMPFILSDEYKGNVNQDIPFFLMFFFWGLAGLPIIIRKDADFGLFRIEGLVAVVLGGFIMICSFALGLLPLW